MYEITLINVVIKTHMAKALTALYLREKSVIIKTTLSMESESL